MYQSTSIRRRRSWRCIRMKKSGTSPCVLHTSMVSCDIYCEKSWDCTLETYPGVLVATGAWGRSGWIRARVSRHEVQTTIVVLYCTQELETFLCLPFARCLHISPDPRVRGLGWQCCHGQKATTTLEFMNHPKNRMQPLIHKDRLIILGYSPGVSEFQTSDSPQSDLQSPLYIISASGPDPRVSVDL